MPLSVHAPFWHLPSNSLVWSDMFIAPPASLDDYDGCGGATVSLSVAVEGVRE